MKENAHFAKMFRFAPEEGAGLPAKGRVYQLPPPLPNALKPPYSYIYV